jgi:Flp pilus assembly protein TadG
MRLFTLKGSGLLAELIYGAENKVLEIINSQFLKDRDGGVAPVFALLAIPLLGLTGAAVDYSQALSVRTAMQSALDSTALAVARQNVAGGQIPGQAQQFFNAVFVRPEIQNLSLAAETTNANGGASVNLSASGVVKTRIMGVVGFSTINIQTHSTALAKTDGLGCVLALNRAATGAVSASGSTTLSLNNCSLYDNSSDAAALNVGGSSRLSALSIGVVGRASYSSSSVTTTEGISTGITPIADPYADVEFPSFSGCTQNKFTAKSTVTIDPGVYCNGLTVNAGANLTLNPGIYYLDRGSLSVNGGASISGQGVTLVFTSSTGNNWATATINGNATVNLTAPLSGPTEGIVIFGDRQIPTGTSFKFDGGASQNLGGAVYLPTGTIDYSGGMGTSTNCTQIIGDKVNFTGNSNVALNCSTYNVRPFGPLIVRLIS